MNVDVYPLFSTPLFKTNLSRSDDDILNFSKKQKFKFLEHVKNGYVSENVYVLNSQELKELKDIIQNNINFFAYEVLGIDSNIEFHITNSWIMKHENGHWAQEHFHSHSLITGVYYFDVKENSGQITITKNKMFTTLFPCIFDFLYEKETLFNKGSFGVTPVNGDLLLFPSHLLHSVSVNKNESERHCLAFNVFIKGTLGNDDSFNRIDFK